MRLLPVHADSEARAWTAFHEKQNLGPARGPPGIDGSMYGASADGVALQPETATMTTVRSCRARVVVTVIPSDVFRSRCPPPPSSFEHPLPFGGET